MCLENDGLRLQNSTLKQRGPGWTFLALSKVVKLGFKVADLINDA